MTEEMIRQISEAIQRSGERPAHEQIKEMIARGVINERGEVLLKGPSYREDDRVPNPLHGPESD